MRVRPQPSPAQPSPAQPSPAQLSFTRDLGGARPLPGSVSPRRPATRSAVQDIYYLLSTIYTIYYLQQGPREIHQLMWSGVLGLAAQTTDLGRRLETLSPKPSSGVGYQEPQIDNNMIKLLLGSDTHVMEVWANQHNLCSSWLMVVKDKDKSKLSGLPR